MKKAVYSGSFDPITNGHIDVLKRAVEVFDEVTILVADNNAKSSRFSVEERLEMIKDATKDMKGVKVDYTDGLTVEYAKKIGATHLVRGIRTVTDFEYEFSLAAANRFIDKSIDIVFFMANSESSIISSSSVDQLAKSGIDISNLVPDSVVKMYQKK